MPKSRTQFIVAVYLFLLKDNQVLLTRRFNTGYQDGHYSTIAGHLEPGEDIFSCLSREAYEEAGILIYPEFTQLFHLMTRKTDNHRLDLFFKTSRWQNHPKICEPLLCDHLDWFDPNQLPSNTIPYIKKVIQTLKKDNLTYTTLT